MKKRLDVKSGKVLDAVAGGEPLFDACRENEDCKDKSVLDFFC